ncbi:MAG TPA: FecR domain-containing protein [Candidatus Limnocylindrales bacterium]|nr:FecR domain-containing protein [Candidatus Limnocylindrales bacterium]
MRAVRGTAGLAVLLGWTAMAAAQPAELPVRVATLAGASEMFAKGADRWTPAKLRAELREGDGARTLATGRLGLLSVNGHALRLAQLSQVFLSGNEPAGADQPLRARLDGGWLWVAVTPGTAARAKVEVRAGPVTVAVRGTGADIRIRRDGSVLVRVFHGLAMCSGPDGRRDWERSVKAGEEVIVAAGGAPGAIQTLTREPTEASWLKWNEEQDASAYGGPPAR